MVSSEWPFVRMILGSDVVGIMLSVIKENAKVSAVSDAIEHADAM
jgi:hypothetical protein